METKAIGSARSIVAKNIKKLRKAAGMSADEVGAAVGKSGKTISAWEVERGQPDADALIALCRLFDVDISDFYGEYSNAESLSKSESELIDIFRKLDLKHQNTLYVCADSFQKAERLGHLQKKIAN